MTYEVTQDIGDYKKGERIKVNAKSGEVTIHEKSQSALASFGYCVPVKYLPWLKPVDPNEELKELKKKLREFSRFLDMTLLDEFPHREAYYRTVSREFRSKFEGIL